MFNYKREGLLKQCRGYDFSLDISVLTFSSLSYWKDCVHWFTASFLFVLQTQSNKATTIQILKIDEGKGYPVTCREGLEGKWRYCSTHSWPWHKMGVGGQCHVPATLPSGKNPGTDCGGSWLGSRSSLDGMEKRKSLASTDIQSPDSPADTESLYWLLFMML